MLKWFWTFCLISCLLPAFAQDWFSEVDSLTQQAVKKLPHSKTDCITLVGIDYDRHLTAEMAEQTLQRIYDNLTTVQKVKVTPPAAVKKVTTNAMPGFSLPATYLEYQAFCDNIYRLTKQATNILWQPVFQKEGDHFTFTINMYNPNTAARIGYVSKQLPLSLFVLPDSGGGE